MAPTDDPLLPENMHDRILGLEEATALSLALLFRDRIGDLDRLEDLAVRVNAPGERMPERVGFRRLARKIRNCVVVLDEMDRSPGG